MSNDDQTSIPEIYNQIFGRSPWIRLAKGGSIPEGMTIKKGRWYWRPLVIRKRTKRKKK